MRCKVKPPRRGGFVCSSPANSALSRFCGVFHNRGYNKNGGMMHQILPGEADYIAIENVPMDVVTTESRPSRPNAAKGVVL